MKDLKPLVSRKATVKFFLTGRFSLLVKYITRLCLDLLKIKADSVLQLIPNLMKGFIFGEGKFSFPLLFFCYTFLLLIIAQAYYLPPSLAQKEEKNKLTIFDQLAEKATLLNKRGQHEEVISLLEPHKNNKKNDSALFFNELGIAYRYKNKFSEAIEAYNLALSRDPQNPVILNNLGYTFYLKKEYKQALECFEKALQLAPFFKEAHANISLTYYQLQNYQRALEEIDQVLKLDPNHDQAKKFRQSILKKIKESKKGN